MSNFIKESWLVLAMALLFAGLLAAAQSTFGPKIQDNKRTEIQEAAKAVVPGSTQTETVHVKTGSVFKCTDDQGKLIGWAVPGEGFGFADKISLVVGLSADADQITGLKVVDNKETPGLGNKIIDPQWAGQYAGLNADLPITVVKRERVESKNEISAITGATISSQKTTNIVMNLIAEVRPKLKELSGSTDEE